MKTSVRGKARSAVSLGCGPAGEEWSIEAALERKSSMVRGNRFAYMD
ncbi:hypothetical protein [Paraburkholderia fynbosensis]|nr:hypothetical protein [Paraburkholderia fynbosensis]